ncbi:MAG: hypothetical protein JXQ75_17495 [Phycisphaerae bacterium]|nr:hypothetical protein [Phycisphaerae bacterium]
MADTIVLVGIDEAGYGPILGPLVVSASAFEVPVAKADACLWDLLHRSVARAASARETRLAILDSKKLYRRKAGVARLERSVLSAIGAWRGSPASMRSLLGLLCPDVLGKLSEYPWYREADMAIPTAADAGGIRIASGLFARDLAAQPAQLAGCLSEVLLEGHYNRLVGNTQNKAVVLSGLTLRLMQRVADAHPNRELRIHVDKQGAREHYGALLLRAFESRRLKVLEESDEYSAYELTGGQARWRISYRQSGESHHLSVALASLVSKYIRELLMACFNAYWTSRVPELQPTAGYYQDGLRFLREVQPHLQRLGVVRNQLVRQR